MLLVVLLSLPAAALSTLAYHLHMAPRPVGMVDAAGLWKRGQTAAAQALVQPDASEAQRREALAEARRFGERLQAALAETAMECRCVLVTSNAVLAGALPDYTETVARRLAVPASLP